MTISAKKGMSLIEIVIALGIFFAVMVAVMQSMVSSMNYINFDESRNEVEVDTIRVQNQFIQDFGNSAWFYEYNSTTYQAQRDAITGARYPLFPYVSTDKKSIEFLKLRTSMTVNSDPKQERYGYVSFRDQNVTPVEFSSYKDASPTPFMILNPSYIADPSWYVAAVWESYPAGLTFSENQDPEKLRHYLYVVEANNRGTNSLVRKYLNGYPGDSSLRPSADQWILDTELMEGVIDVNFSTHLEDSSLNENQIRITVAVERQPQASGDGGTARVRRTIDMTVAMRSINQE